MAPGEITAERQKQIPLLKSFKCRVCSKFKEPGLYSNKELNTYRWKVTAGARPTAVNAQLRCRDCAGSGVHELQCKQCDKWKELEEFSKAARMAGGSGWCKACTLWKEAAQYDIIPQAHPSGDLAPDEDPSPASRASNNSDTQNNNNGYSSDPEAGSDDDYESYSAATSAWLPAPTPPVHSSTTSSWGPANPNITSSAAALSQLSISSHGWGVPIARSSNSPRAVAPVLGPSSDPRMRNGNVAQGMGAAEHKSWDTRTVSSVSNPYEGRMSTSTSNNGWSAVGSCSKAKADANAWDSNGVDYIHKRFSSAAVSDAGSTVTSSTTRTTTTANARPTVPVTTTRSGWAKPIGSKNKPNAYNALDHQPQHRRQDDEDSEEDM